MPQKWPLGYKLPSKTSQLHAHHTKRREFIFISESPTFQNADSEFKNTFKRVIDRYAHARVNRSKRRKFYSNQSRFGEHNHAHQADKEESSSQDEKSPADILEHTDSDEELRDILADLMSEGDLE
ncbi:hypothetical protein K3495_g3651 [Podosphaera aphanis]|nr:hypothetical protein K3495_g3651 [Podosphaera aphanis]